MAVDEKVRTTHQLQFNLTVDKKTMRLVYAECDRFMADALFSFLITPVGALVRCTGKNSRLGCMDSLYKSVEDIGVDHFETPACKQLLLRPRSSFGFAHHRLKLRVNDAEEFFFTCPSSKCPKWSLFSGVKCNCGAGDSNDPAFMIMPPPIGSDEVFVGKHLDSFVVTDDLFISTSSDALKHRLCCLAGVENHSSCLEQHVVVVDDDKMVELMKSAILSSTPLTDTFLPSYFVPKPVHLPLDLLQQHFIKTDNLFFTIMKKLVKGFLRMITPTWRRKKMSITLFHNEERVVLARVKRDFADLLLSFLTFPLGSIVTALGRRSSLGCINNIQQVVKRFGEDRLFFKQESEPTWLANYLLNPPIAPHHNCANELLKIGDKPYSLFLIDCESCDTGLTSSCTDPRHTEFKMKVINPKFERKQRTTMGKGYMRRGQDFVVTTDLGVVPINDFGGKNIAAGLEKRCVDVGTEKALELLMASLIYEDPLTSVFLQADKKYYRKKS